MLDLQIVVVGAGVVGSALLKQLSEAQPATLLRSATDLRLRAVARSATTQSSPDRLAGPSFRGAAASTDLPALAGYAADGRAVVVVDCTASADVSALYARWLGAGCHVVTANKRANAGPLREYAEIRAAQARGGTHFFYEANVGAGLPIISTVRDLVRTGDVFLQVEGVLSGTLSYVFNEFDGREPFSTVVARARRMGYTEPEPRDDLGGVDVARKVVILAREIGVDVELSDVPVRSLVPPALRGDDVSTQTFMERLPEFDASLTAMACEAAAAGELLRYVGVVNAQTGACAVELRRYARSHPFGRLQGSDNIVSLRTRRYDAQPLVIQGPGAGADVTAAGVFADILRVAAHLGAPSVGTARPSSGALQLEV
jgi:bifunctional aspartokinase / homoserine dehydrogenase 1